MIAKIKLTSPDKFYKLLQKKIPSRIEGNRLIIDKQFGEGGMSYIKIQDGLYVNQINLKINTPVTLQRTPSDVNDYFILNFHLSRSEIVQQSGEKAYKLGFENINILLASARTEATISIPAGVPVKIFNIGFTIEWLKEHILASRSKDIFSIFHSDNPIYLFETINYLYKKKLKLTDLQKQDKLSVASGTFQLLEHFFNQVSKRNLIEVGYSNIIHSEFMTMIKIRERIDNSVDDMDSVDELAKQAGMSLSKFKQLFRQIFGTTPYQYYLANRMEKAMELLESKSYAVSEVGFLVGYSNPSQFTKAFQKHFGTLPSAIK